MNTNQKALILYITTGLYTGGAERMLYNLLTKINQQRFEPVVVSLINRGTWGDHIEKLGIPIYTLGMKQGSLPTPAIILRLHRIIHQIQPDLIQGWMYHGNLAALLAESLASRNIPVIWNIQHSMYSLKYEKQMTQYIIRLGAQLSKKPRSIVFVSQIGKKQHEAIGFYSKNGCVIPNASDNSLFVPSTEAKYSVRTELGLSEDSFLIGKFARFHPMKDHVNFLKAAAILVKKRQNVHFLLAGTQVERDNSELQQLIENLGISQQVHLLGERRDMPRLTAALNILTVASAFGEAFPLVIGEAMSCGVPCVVTDVGDSTWIVSNTGRSVPPKHPQALANAWQELIELSTHEREALGQAARARIMEHFSLQSVVNQYEELYEQALNKQFYVSSVS